MRLILKFFMYMLYFLLAAIVLIAVVGFIFLKTSPQFGGSHTEADIERYRESGHYEAGKFQNPIPTSMDMSAGETFSTMIEFFKGGKDRQPDFELPVNKVDSVSITDYAGPTEMIWFGHSAFMLLMDGQRILIDPMLGMTPSPHKWLGGKRFSKQLPIDIASMPPIDAVIISHDHYDHLDYGSIRELKDKTGMFYVPLGVGAHLEEWGVAAEKIVEMDWWDHTDFNGLELTFLPSRHFSGRGLTDRFATLWGSWAIRGSKQNLYFSGDSGYGPHFEEIGEKLGPFDFVMLECGQYNIRWKEIHMMPEETAQAALDLKAEVMMPIHWGAFTLALHSWTDPVERVLVKADELSVPVYVPKIGEPFEIQALPKPISKWWMQ